MRKRLLLCLAALLVGGAAPLPVPPAPAWTRPTAPFHVVGPIYYVGSEGLSVYLIRTSRGLILLDATVDENIPMIERNIAALGFRLGDVKLLLLSHAHFDHAGGMARLKHDTGAALAVSAGDRGAVESGTPPSDSPYVNVHFTPVKIDRLVVEGRPVRLGNISLTPLVTPGHTPGCTTWTMRVVENGRPLDVVFPCSSMNAGSNTLVHNKGYPEVVRDLRATFARVRNLHADIVLPPHPEFADLLGRARRRDAGDANAFLGPDVLRRMIDDAEKAFHAQLAKEEGQ